MLNIIYAFFEEKKSRACVCVLENGVLLDCFALFELYIFVTALDFIYLFIRIRFAEFEDNFSSQTTCCSCLFCQHRQHY